MNSSVEKVKIETNSVNYTSNAAISNFATNVVTTANSVTTITKEFQTPNSIRKTRNGTFHSFPMVNTQTPPSRFRKIVNPFEVGLTERLHLPLIDRYI